MSGPTLIPPGGGEIVGDSADRRVEILCEVDQLHATWSRFGPGREGAGLHIHHHHTDLFYVLDGELTVRLGIDDANVAVPAGTLVLVPPMVVHGFRNAGDRDVRYLNLHAPGCGFAGYMRGLRDGTNESFDQHDPPADGGRPASAVTLGGETTVIDESGRRVELLADFDELAIERVVLEPGAASPGADAVFVLEGDAAIDAARAPAGAWAWLGSSAGAAVTAQGSDPVSFLSLRVPSAGS